MNQIRAWIERIPSSGYRRIINIVRSSCPCGYDRVSSGNHSEYRVYLHQSNVQEILRLDVGNEYKKNRHVNFDQRPIINRTG